MSQQIKIHVMHTGLVKVDRALPFHGLYRNLLAFTGLFRSEKNQVTLPVSSYLIEHPKGLLLVDTGWHRLVRQSNWAELGLKVQINTCYLPAGWAVDERLAALGYQPKDLDYVLLSHLHCDHASGLKLVQQVEQHNAILRFDDQGLYYQKDSATSSRCLTQAPSIAYAACYNLLQLDLIINDDEHHLGVKNAMASGLITSGTSMLNHFTQFTKLHYMSALSKPIDEFTLDELFELATAIDQNRLVTIP